MILEQLEVFMPPFQLFLLSAMRLYGVVRISPFMAGRLVNEPVRNVLVLSLALIVFPLVRSQAPQGLSLDLHYVLLMGKEFLVGVFFGFMGGIPFWVAMNVGFFIDNQRGASMAGLFDANLQENTSPLGVFFMQVLLVIMFSSGGILIFLQFIFRSYQALPVFGFFPDLSAGQFAHFFMAQFNGLMRLTMILAAPVVFVCVLTDIGLGIINRFAPQLNVFFLSMPLKSGLALVILILYGTILLKFFKDQLIGIDSLIRSLIPVLS